MITGDAVLVGEDSGETASGTLELVKQHVPLELSDDDILVSFRIDDVEVFDKPRTEVRGTLRASESPDGAFGANKEGLSDITFETKQKQVLENALYLARKYNITFDLAVIAKPFDERAMQELKEGKTTSLEDLKIELGM